MNPWKRESNEERQSPRKMCYGFEQQQRSERAKRNCSRNRTGVCEYISSIEMPVAVNEVLYDNLISLNRVFVFTFVWCLCIGAPPKDPTQKTFLVFWEFPKNKRNKRVPKSKHNKW